MVYVCIWEKDWDGVTERLEWPQECTIGLYHEEVYKQFWKSFDDAWDLKYEEMMHEYEPTDNKQEEADDEADDIPDSYDEVVTLYNKFVASPLRTMQIDTSVPLGQYIDTLKDYDITIIAFYIVINMTQSVDKYDFDSLIQQSNRISLTCRKLGLYLHPDRHPEYSEFVHEVYKNVNNIKSMFDFINT